MSIEIKLPNLGENVESGDVLTVLVAEGDEVTVDQGLVELETDKATLEVPSPEAGRIVKILVGEGDTITTGTPIVSLEPGGAAANTQSGIKPAKKRESKAPAEVAPKKQVAPPAPPAAPVATAPAAPSPASPPREESIAAAPAGPSNDGPSNDAPAGDVDAPGDTDQPGDGRSGSPAGPAVRRLARELGVDLRWVRGTAEGGRITREDVNAYIRAASLKEAAETNRGVTPPGFPGSDGYGATRREKMSRMRQTIARNMTHSYTTIPQLTNFDDADVTELDKIRKESKADYASQGIKLTSLPFIIKAVAAALNSHPIINSSLDEETKEIVYKEYVHIGIAVDTDRGLVVPVMRNADRMNIPQIARALADIAENARSGKFAIEDLRGGTFTISNLGAIGGTYSTPIINPPEVAILLAGRSRILPVFVDGHVEPRLMLPLSITYDHRIVDGAAAARFLNDVKGYLSAPGRLLLAR